MSCYFLFLLALGEYLTPPATKDLASNDKRVQDYVQGLFEDESNDEDYSDLSDVDVEKDNEDEDYLSFLKKNENMSHLPSENEAENKVIEAFSNLIIMEPVEPVDFCFDNQYPFQVYDFVEDNLKSVFVDLFVPTLNKSNFISESRRHLQMISNTATYLFISVFKNIV